MKDRVLGLIYEWIIVYNKDVHELYVIITKKQQQQQEVTKININS